MHWNYRIIKNKHLSIASVYYEDNKPILYSEADLRYFTGKKALKETYLKIWEAFDRPILKVKDIK
jgi:hypothetical protein